MKEEEKVQEEKINLHETQIEALNFLVDSLNQNKKVVGLIGAGGTGKSEILSRLQSFYIEPQLTDDTFEVSEGINNEKVKDIYYSATTNKAVSRLLEVVPEAKTIHSLTSIPVYTILYEELLAFYSKKKEIYDEKELKKFVNEYRFFSNKTKNFISYNNIDLLEHRTINDLLAKLKMTPFSKEMFVKYKINEQIENSIVCIDESSMLPYESIYENDSLVKIGLDVACKVFENVILIGDSEQLPPIDGESVFTEGLKCYELTENFRSEKDLLHAIQWAREGKSFHNYESKSKNVKIVNGISDRWYKATYGRKDVAHIVYRNKTRKEITKKIREGHSATPNNGEPVLLRGRGNDIVNKGEIGVYEAFTKKVYFEKGELNVSKYSLFDEYVKEKYGKFQFGYALTCHLAQGSSFDNVIVYVEDIPFFIDEKDKLKWIYTAVSRARKTITIVL